MSSLPFNFLGLEPQYADFDRVRYVVWPIGYDATVSYRTGSREGPVAIIAASRQMELFDPQLGREVHKAGVATLDPFDPDVSSSQATVDAIFAQAKRVLGNRKFLIGLGGEHTISFPLIKAQAQRTKKLSVLHIDAHCDMRDTWQNSKFSHACVIRRVHELGLPTVSVGIRNISQEEHRYIRKHNVSIVTAEAMHVDAAGQIDSIVDQLTENVYVTIDMDGFDPACAPGVGTPEPGGLDWFQVNGLLTRLAASRRIVGADVVETLPVPGQVVTEFLAAKLATRIIALTQID